MKILAIDTTSKNCSIAIVEHSNDSFKVLSNYNDNDEKTHSQKLMPMIQEMFLKLGMSLSDIDLLACCIGPGSFTGIRIGIATVKAFGDVKNIPIASITSLESLAYNVENEGYIFPIIDAKNQNVYSAEFYHEGLDYSIKCECFSDTITNTLQRFSSHLNEIKSSSPSDDIIKKEIIFIGDGTLVYKNLIKESFKDFNITFHIQNEQSAVSLAKCAYQKFLENKVGSSETVSPIYLRKSQAERIANGENI